MRHYYVEFTSWNEKTGKHDLVGKIHYTKEKGVVIDKELIDRDLFAKNDDGKIGIFAGDKFSTPDDGLEFLSNVSVLYSGFGRFFVSQVIEEKRG